MKLATLKAFFKGVDIDYVWQQHDHWFNKCIELQVEYVLEVRKLNLKIKELEQGKESWIDRDKLQQALDFDEQRRDEAMNELVAWQQEFENSAQIIGNKPTNYAKLKEDFE